MLVETPLEIVLEFARAEATGDPHAFRFAPQSYIVRTPRGGFGSSELPWDQELLGRLQAVRRPGQDPGVLAEVGETLRRFLAPTGWEVHEQNLSAAIRQRRPVHITIRSAAAELFALPWELLTLHATGQSLGGLPGVLVRYEWPETETTTAPADPSGGRILVAWSAAGGEVPAAEHIAAIQAAASAGAFAFDAATDVLPRASPGRVAAALAEAEAAGRPIAALHLLCHGGGQGSSFGLVLDGDAPSDPPALLDPARLQQLLAPLAGSLRLVVLAACDSGNQGDLGGRLGSAAQRLHRAGFAAVVASRYPLSLAGSSRLTEVLYRRLLADQLPLEEAFVAARTALTSHTLSLDWASVQLYARADDGARTYPITPPPASVAATTSPSPAAADPAPAALTSAGPTRWSPSAVALAVVAIVAAIVVAIVASGPLGAGDPATPATTATTIEVAGSEGPKTSAATGDPGEDKPVPEDISTGTATTTTTAANESTPPQPTTTTSADNEGASGGTSPTKTKKRPPPPMRPSVECPSAVKSYVRTLLPGGGGAVVRLVIKGSPTGSLTAVGDSAAADAARRRLGGASAAKVQQQAGDGLPCHFTYEWATSG